MSQPANGKLVRDRTREALEPKNPRVTFSRVLEDQREGLLFAKLLEEAGEWLRARDGDGRRDRALSLKELGDLFEVICALGQLDNISAPEILAESLGKRMARGGFDDLLVMSVETREPTIVSVPEPPRPTNYSPPPESHPSIGDGRWYSG